ncbi:hypothetical protein JYT22_01010 [Endomicrobium sp. AH-315-J14]|nr:hypothetical protein [Endomicrobium sp. AH-315-J14]
MVRSSFTLFTALAGLGCVLSACGDDEPAPAGVGGAGGTGGSMGGGDEGGVEPCEAHEATADDGSCALAGVPVGSCGEGFESDGRGGCTAVLPAEPCDPGMVALPGETKCRYLADCGEGKWGNIPDHEKRIHVDANYKGGESDGSEEHPFTTIQNGIHTFAPKETGLVAVAAGEYDELIYLGEESPVAVWGRCPQMVKVRGFDEGALLLAGDDASVYQMDLSNPNGLVVLHTDGQRVLLDRVWIHAASDFGVWATHVLRSPELELRDSLIEDTTKSGLFGLASSVTVTRSVIRDIRPDDTGTVCGISVQSAQANPASLTLIGSIVSQTSEVAVSVSGGTAVIKDTLITLGRPDENGRRGLGIAIQQGSGGVGTEATIEGSVIRDTYTVGLAIVGATVTLRNSVVEDTKAQPVDGGFGDGIAVVEQAGLGELILESSRVAGSARAGISNFSATVSLSSAALECNTIDLDGEQLPGPFSFHNASPSACYCGADVIECKVLSTNLAPPDSL